MHYQLMIRCVNIRQFFKRKTQNFIRYSGIRAATWFCIKTTIYLSARALKRKKPKKNVLSYFDYLMEKR